MAKNQFFNVTVGRKILMALTGLFLCSFLIIHLTGNFGLYSNDGGQGFNEYTLFMTTNPLIRFIEIVLVIAFVLHIILAARITAKNRSARSISYAVNKVHETSTWYSRNMGITGSVILIFLIIHLKTFWYEYKFGDPGMDAWGNRDMYTVVLAAFDQWWYAGLYMLAMMLLGAHLVHGFQSAFRSLGLNNKKYAPAIYKTGVAFAILMTLGFISFPIVFYFFN